MPTHKRRWPAEWEPHAATWLAWPHNEADWPDKFEPIPWVYASIIGHLRQHEKVKVLVSEHSHLAAVSALRRCGMEADGASIEFVPLPTDRVWTRDFGPLWIDQAGQALAVKWRFNAWAKYENWEQDEEAGRAMADWTDAGVESPQFKGQPVVLEGGSIDGNGAGTVLTSEECLLSSVQCRNPGMTREDYESVLAQAMGIRKVIWLQRGIVGDDTHGHVDDLARFVDRQTVLLAVEDDPADENYEPLRENLERLQGQTNADGEPLRVISLPMPKPVYFDGQRLPASYANFYIANGLVLVPTFNDPNDRRVLNLLAEAFPERRIVGIHALDLVWGLGTLHCMTMQQPALG